MRGALAGTRALGAATANAPNIARATPVLKQILLSAILASSIWLISQLLVCKPYPVVEPARFNAVLCSLLQVFHRLDARIQCRHVLRIGRENHVGQMQRFDRLAGVD